MDDDFVQRKLGLGLRHSLMWTTKSRSAFESEEFPLQCAVTSDRAVPCSGHLPL